MSGITLIGIIIIAGFVLGELADTLNLPKVTGYIIAGILLKLLLHLKTDNSLS